MRRPVTWVDLVGAVVGVAMCASFLVRTNGESAGLLPLVAVTICAGSVGGRLLTFVHEMGHAVAAVALTPQRVMLHVGDGPDPLRFSVGRIDMRLSVRTAPGLLGHVEFLPPGLSQSKLFLIAVGGPLASAVAAIALAVATVALAHPGDLVFWGLVLCTLEAALGVANLVPRTFRYQRLPGAPLVAGMTDGLIALKALRGEVPFGALVRSTSSEAAAMGPAAREVILTALATTEPGTPVGAKSLLAALAVTEGPAQRLLAEHDVPFWPARRYPGATDRPSTAAFDHVCRRAPRLRSLNGAPDVTPLHLLLALLDEPTEETAQLLAAAGVDREALRADTVAALARSASLPPGRASKAVR